jgi:hypothetical protein
MENPLLREARSPGLTAKLHFSTIIFDKLMTFHINTSARPQVGCNAVSRIIYSRRGIEIYERRIFLAQKKLTELRKKNYPETLFSGLNEIEFRSLCGELMT